MVGNIGHRTALANFARTGENGEVEAGGVTRVPGGASQATEVYKNGTIGLGETERRANHHSR